MVALMHEDLESALADDPMTETAAQVGDRWTMLIVWAAANGVTRFDDFHRDLHVARNILSNRLRKLVDLRIVEKRPVREGGRRMEYALTDKGLALRDALDSLREWGRNWPAES